MVQPVSNRDEALSAIVSELDYQNKKWNPETTATCHDHTVGDYLVYMKNYLDEAFAQLSRNGDPVASNLALNTIRKVAALGVACMVQNGAPRREGF